MGSGQGLEERSTPGVNLDRKKHQKFREGTANASFQLVRRRSRLPPREKKNIVVSQLLPNLTYGAEVHEKPSKKGEMHAAEWNTGGWRGSNRERLAAIAGVEVRRKRMRWAASVYEPGLEELKETAEGIFEDCLEQDTILRWPEGSGEKIKNLEILKTAEGAEAVVYTNGSWI